LPKPSLIIEPANTAYMIFISSMGICGEDDFKCLRLKEARIPEGKSGGNQLEKRRYALDIGSLLAR
jgi:hypothetical protein